LFPGFEVKQLEPGNSIPARRKEAELAAEKKTEKDYASFGEIVTR
jgi:hypothetical protein